jgi:hypothetical protein
VVYIRLRKVKQKQIGGINGYSANVFRGSDYFGVCRRKNGVVGMKTMLVSHIPLTNLLIRVKATPINQSATWGVYSIPNGLIMTEWEEKERKWKYTRQNNQ